MTEEISLSLSLPKEITDILKSKSLSNEIKLLCALELYREGIVSLGKASDIAGIGLNEMIYELKKRKIPFNYDQESFKEDLEVIGELL